MYFRFIVSSIVILFFNISNISSNDVAGCGGFVNFKSNHGNSAVKVKLFSNKGVVKYTSDIAPNNGYYFIPLYDHGEYILRVDSPKGFFFEPQQVKINFDGKTDFCSKQEDINFNFLGFGIFGKVTSPNSQKGPANIQLNLFFDGISVQQQITNSNGEFEFSKILPGVYHIEATHDFYLFKQSSFSVTVENSNIQLPEGSLQISGYPLQGNVLNERQPISGVDFAIFSKSVPSINCNIKIIPSFVSKLEKHSDLKFLCSTQSDETGGFRFSSLPNGKYVIIPFYENHGTRFEVSPNQLEFSLNDQEIVIEKPFEIDGFTVSGLVKNHLKPEDKIIPEKITFSKTNGEVLVAKINNDGSYSVENIRSGKYSIKVTSQKYFFDEKQVEISPKSIILPVLNPSKFQICGSVLLKSNSENIDQLKLGIMEFIDSKTSLQYFPFKPPKFCAMISEGKYSAFIESPLNGPQFVPKSIELNLKEPKNDLIFEKFSAKISGKVAFKSNLNLEKIELILSQGNRQINKKTFNFGKEAFVEFIFEDVNSGEYSVSLGKDLTDKFCWEKDSLSLTVSNSNVDKLLFEQKGYMCKISLSHASDIIIKSPSNKIFNIAKDTFGVEQFEKQCLEESGSYEIHVKSCHVFSEQPFNLFHFDTSRVDQLGQVLKLNAQKHMISGLIETASNLTDLGLKIHTANEIRTLKFEDFGKNFINNQVVYTFSFYEKPNTKIQIEPTSDEVLFKPSSQEIVLENECFSLKNNFVGKRGLKIEGFVEKNISDVDITVFNRATHEVLCITKTDKTGSYTCGPFSDDIRLRIEASKDGFHFKNSNTKLGNFETFKLSSISGQILTENGEKMQEVLVSISGGENNFRKNVIFNGNFHFENLQPAEYFVRFMKKEFEFQPQSEMISVKDGEDVSKIVKGIKVAFSCIGKVTALNGEPEVGVTVEAVSLRENENIDKTAIANPIECSQIQEEAITDEEGVYKILGLTPQCLYEVRLKNDSNDQVRNSIPRRRNVTVLKEDIHHVDFVALYKTSMADVSVYVKGKSDLLKSLTVKLFRSSAPGDILYEQKLQANNPFIFFPSLEIDNSEYSILLESDLPARMFENSFKFVKKFLLSDSFMHFRLLYNPKLMKPELNSISGRITDDIDEQAIDGVASNIKSAILLALLTFGLVYFYHKQIFEFLNGLSQASVKNGEGEENLKKNKNKVKKL